MASQACASCRRITGADLCRTTTVCRGGKEKQLLVLAEEEECELGARQCLVCQGNPCHPSTTSRCSEVKAAKPDGPQPKTAPAEVRQAEMPSKQTLSLYSNLH